MARCLRCAARFSRRAVCHRPILLSISTALPTIASIFLSISAALLSISVGVGMTSAAPEGVLARIETMSVGFC